MDMWQIHQGEVTIACDNISALKTAIDIKAVPFISPAIADFDIMQSIRQTMRPGILYRYKHVKGHQDDESVILDHLAELNVHMDALAKEKRLTILDTTNNWHPVLPYEKWKILINNTQITKGTESTIRDSLDRKYMQNYWNRKGKVQTSQFNNVGWTAIGKAMKTMPTGRRHWIATHASGICGVNYIKQIWKERDNPDCPRCGEVERAKHVWSCRHAETQEIWNAAIQDLRSTLTSQKTDPSITYQLCSGLMRWYSGEDLRITDPRPLIIQQCDIGWDCFIEGIIGMHWGKQQQIYFQSINSRRSGLRWTIALIKKLWNIAWDLWSHRNGIEHARDLTIEIQQLDEDIEFCIDFHVLSTNEELENMFHPDEIEKVRVSSRTYKKAWINNVRAMTERQDRRQINNRELVGMRRIMQNFLHRAVADT